jgi:hypothetical protein
MVVVVDKLQEQVAEVQVVVAALVVLVMAVMEAMALQVL